MEKKRSLCLGAKWLAAVCIFANLNTACKETVSGDNASLKQHESGIASAQDLAEEIIFFHSGDLKLRGKLVSPKGAGPFPLIVLVHGSGKLSAVDTYTQHYLFARSGFASLVFDKRGTGQSGGKFTDSFTKLADDVVAAVHHTRGLNKIDGRDVGLVAYSQGGWVAPLAATKSSDIKFILINYGPAVTPAREDSWSTLAPIRSRSSDVEIQEATELIEAVHNIIQCELSCGWSEFRALVERFKERPWFRDLSNTESNTAAFINYTEDQLRQFFSQLDSDTGFFYDPIPVLAKVEIPIFWIFGGKDNSMPTEESVQNLQPLIAARGKHFTIKIFPNADHGIIDVEIKDGARIRQGRSPGYDEVMVSWLKKQVRK